MRSASEYRVRLEVRLLLEGRERNVQTCTTQIVADNIDLPLITMEYMAYYRLRFQKEPLLCRKLMPGAENVTDMKQRPKTPKQ